MSDVKGVDTATLQNLGLIKDVAKKKSEMGQDQFLKLMIAQMKNQNPLEPQNNAEFLSQMAQFGTVEGIGKLQNSFSTLASSLQSNQALQASALVGRQVLVPGSQMDLTSGGSISGSVDVSSSTSDLKIGVFNQKGELVRNLSLGAKGAGPVGFTWDGKLDDGSAAPTGSYRVVAEGLTGKEVTGMPTSINANVDSVTLGKGAEGITLNLAGIGKVPFSSVKEIK